MPYGKHWEWRGFGQLDPEIRENITRLPPAYAAAHTVTDQYLWVPGLETNIKLRTWTGGASLKFKHLLLTDVESGIELWQEHRRDDYVFPLAAEPLQRLRTQLGVDLGCADHASDPGLLAAELMRSGVEVVPFSKLRRLFVWSGNLSDTFVELAELSTPVPLNTVGIEDRHGLCDESTSEQINDALRAVTDARTALGLPGTLRTGSYLSVVADWVRDR